MYHKKIGILEDENKDKIVFSGSMNLTVRAIKSNKYNPKGNSEEFSTYPSWNKETFDGYGIPKIDNFERAWKGNEPNTTIADMPSEHYERIKKHYNVPIIFGGIHPHSSLTYRLKFPPNTLSTVSINDSLETREHIS